MLRLREATTEAEIEHFRRLCLEYEASLNIRLSYQGFHAEMQSLPGKYAPPQGCIILAYASPGSDPVGCAALRPIPPRPGEPEPVTATARGICELKRMYVAPAARNQGIGRALGREIVTRARAKNYALIRLDTEADMTAAIAVYTRLGFVSIPRYNDDPHPETRWYELDLTHPGRTQ